MKVSFKVNRMLSLLLVLAMLLGLCLTGCVSSGNGTTGGNATTGGNTDQTPGNGDDGPQEGQVLYTIAASGVGGMTLSGITVNFVDQQGLVAKSGTTDEKGEFNAWLDPAEYTVKLEGLREGYTAEEVKTTVYGGYTEVIANTAVITDIYPELPKGKTYAKGDVMYDFSYLTADGQTVRLSELLKTKKLVIINFWATWCGPCRSEFPAINTAYSENMDDVAMVAFSTSDNAEACAKFRAENEYLFDMLPDIGLYKQLTNNATSVPWTIFIDRYGVINNIITGGDSNVDAWRAEMEWYAGDDYSQNGDAGYVPPDEPVKEKPDVQMPDSSVIESAINGEGFNGTYTASDDEYVWPWVVSESGKYIEPSNYGKAGTTALINTTVDLKPGQVLAFDYEYSIEYDVYGYVSYDLFAVYVDGKLMQTMFKKQNGKTTCYVYAPRELEAGKHTVTLAYVKDDSGDSWGFMEPGKEYIRVGNMRVVSVETITESTDLWNTMAYGETDDAKKSQYKHYDTNIVFNEDDGYYHIGTVDGPFLLAKVTGATQWSATSLELLGYNGYLKIDGVDYYKKYFSAETYYSYTWKEAEADIHYVPVDETLRTLLEMIAENVGEGANHENEWLEFCGYFRHYGEGRPINRVTDLRSAVDAESAYEAHLGENKVVVNHAYVPRGTWFKFVPERTGVYRIYTKLDEGSYVCSDSILSTVVSVYGSEGWGNELTDDYNGTMKGNFNVYQTMKAGETYYIAAGFDPIDTLGWFTMMIEDTGLDKLDVMKPCTDAYTTTEDASHIIMWQNAQFAMGTDGYYHQVINGEIDYSETGYIYLNFLGVSDGSSKIPYKGDYCTLKNYIENGYAVYDENEPTKLVLKPGAFNFTDRANLGHAEFGDLPESYKDAGNYQTVMEKYLAEALAKDQKDVTYGYVAVNEELAKILSILMDMYGMQDTDGSIVANQWFMFCSYADHV